MEVVLQKATVYTQVVLRAVGSTHFVATGFNPLENDMI